MRSISAVISIILLLIASYPLLAESEGGEPFTANVTRDLHPLDIEGNITGLYDGILTYEDTALIVNDNSAVSKEIADYFVERRNIPRINIINITVPTDEIIDFDEFDDLLNQISTALSDRDLTDSIDYLITTKGVPLKITSGYTNMNDQRYYNSASVDSELMLMDSEYESDIHRRWQIENPYFEANKTFSREDFGIRLVTRLTGYTVEEAKRLVDLAEPSLGVRGEAYLDMDPGKGVGSTGYGMGNKWMIDANDWLVENDHISHLDNEVAFQTDLTNVSAYFSWGSNDANWNANQMTNTGFEAGTGPIPSGWAIEAVGGIVERTTETVGSGDYSLKMTRNSSGVIRAYQDMVVNYDDHRFIADGRMRASDVTSPGARIVLEGYDASSTLLWTHTLTNRTGTRNWYYIQDPIENISGTVRIRYIVELLGDGTVYFDQNFIRVIRPHNEWVPGSIAETIVSTGGRSQTYGTWYGQSLISDLIRDGVTGLKGYAWEPFINAISHPDIFIPAYYRGYNLAEALWMGSEMGSWMGYVVGDPKCTPYLNERGDMGFSQELPPLETFVDDNGDPYVTIRLHNKGNSEVREGQVELLLEGYPVWKGRVNIPARGDALINISSVDEPIIGSHRFMIILNGDEAIWEYDEKNNVLEMNLTVNSIPTLDLKINEQEVYRTSPLNIETEIADVDNDITLDGLSIKISGPLGMIHTPAIIRSTNMTGSLSLLMAFSPPWNATLGFYTIRGRYDDPNGSFSESLLYSSFKVLNMAPTISGEVPLEEVPRSSEFQVNLTWKDDDTPDDDLEIDIYATRTMGGRIKPISVNATSNNSVECTFTIPITELSGTWSIIASATDRDGAISSWESNVKTFNEKPSMEVVAGMGQNITRLDTASFTIRYNDPEERAASQIDLKVFGPTGSGGEEIVLERELSLENEEERTFTISARSLAIGDYALRLFYEDDERAGADISFQPLFTVNPIAPEIMEPAVSYTGGDGPPGGSFIKGNTISINIPINDIDIVGDPLIVDAVIGLPSGETRELVLTNRGDGNYRAKIPTEGWEVGPYSLDILVTDGDGMTSSLSVDILFELKADLPLFDEGEVFVRSNNSADAEIFISVTLSSSRPVSVELFLYDGNDTLIGEFYLTESSGFGLWQGNGTIDGNPIRGSIRVIDDIGRTIWMNETLTFRFEEKDSNPDVSEDVPEDEQDYLIFILIAVVAFMIILIAVLILVVTRSKRSRMMAPPPMTTSLPPASGHASLPQVQTAALPPGSTNEISGPAPINELPPGKIMENGGSYHRPVEQAPVPKTDEHKPAENNIAEDGHPTDVPRPPEPAPHQEGEMPQAPAPISDGVQVPNDS